MQQLKDLPDYYQYYLNGLADISPFEKGDIQEALGLTFEKTLAVYEKIYEQQSGYSYADGKWTIIEVLGHLIDVERIFAYRALRIARGDQQNFHSFDENEYVTQSNYHLRDFNQVKQELMAVQETTGYLYEGFTEGELERLGKASGFSLSPRSIGFVIAAHRNHHINILKERYLNPDYKPTEN